MTKHNKLTIVEQLDTNKFVVELQEINELQVVTHFSVQHDFVEFSGISMLHTDYKRCPKIEGHTFANCISFYTPIQIPIFPFYKIVLPYLNNSEFLKPENVLKLKTDNDGNPIPDQYNYDYTKTIIKVYNRNKKMFMYHVKLHGESEYNIVTEKFYKTFIEPTL